LPGRGSNEYGMGAAALYRAEPAVDHERGGGGLSDGPSSEAGETAARAAAGPNA